VHHQEIADERDGEEVEGQAEEESED